jgi:hypothetical protein
MSLRKPLRMLVMGIIVAGCTLVIPSHFGTVDDACADGGCPNWCPRITCVTPGCGEDGVMPTTACTYVVFEGPHYVDCEYGCRTLQCDVIAH